MKRKMMNPKKRKAGAVCAGMLAAVILLCGCALSASQIQSQKLQAQASSELGLDLSDAKVLSSSDDHGGMSDGVSLVRLRDRHGAVRKQIRSEMKDSSSSASSAEKNTGESTWKKLPMDRTARTLAYGIRWRSRDGSSEYGAGPYLTDENGDTILPAVKHGYYILIDRQNDAGKDDDSRNDAGQSNTGQADTGSADILKRASFNLTIGLYDSDRGILYCARLDT